jgi:hypothetical protein
MRIFMVYMQYNAILFLCGLHFSFSFQLINQKMFEMKIQKMAHLTYLVIFHLKVIVCQNVNLPHTYVHHFEKHPFVICY